MNKNILVVIVAVVVIVVAGVGVFEYNSSHSTGTLKLSAMDSPILSSVSAVYITFSAIELHNSQAGVNANNSSGGSSGWTNYSFTTRTVNIFGVQLNNSSLFGTVTIPAGNYTMIRIFISSVSVSVAGTNVSFNLSSPFGFINHPFKVLAGSTTNMIFEFNLSSCLNLTSKTFTPYLGINVS